MSAQDRLSFQAQLAAQLDEQHRRPFRGGLVLSLTVWTTDREPSHPHHIAKNLLDLLGAPIPELGITRKGLLYYDDRQVQGLSVRCHHGQTVPRVVITAVPLGCFLEDLQAGYYAEQLAGDAARYHHPQYPDEDRHARQSMELLGDLLREESEQRSAFGDEAFESRIDFVRSDAQEWVLGQTAFSVSELARMFRVLGDPFFTGSSHREVAAQVYARHDQQRDADHLFRILLNELPQEPGTGQAYRETAGRAIRAFRDRFGWVLNPLRVPIGVEVLVKPPPPSRTRGLHDLDNVVRNYVVPSILNVFDPPYAQSYYDFNELRAATFKQMRAAKLRLPGAKRERSGVPLSARVGVARYEAWRLPRALGDESPGFVSVAVVADRLNADDAVSKVDRAIWSLDTE